jgi:hypothetical protein
MGFTIRQLIEETEEAARQIGVDAAKRVTDRVWNAMRLPTDTLEVPGASERNYSNSIGSSGRNS